MTAHGAAATRVVGAASASPTVKEGLIAYLDFFERILQVGGCSGYRVLADRADVQLAFCWFHVRCRFYETRRAGSRALQARTISEAAERPNVADNRFDPWSTARAEGRAGFIQNPTNAAARRALWPAVM